MIRVVSYLNGLVHACKCFKLKALLGKRVYIQWTFYFEMFAGSAELTLSEEYSDFNRVKDTCY